MKIYDIKTQKYLKNIDVKKILEEYPNYQVDEQFQVVWSEGKEKIAIEMQPSDKSAYELENRKILLIDFDTEEVELKNFHSEELWTKDESLKPTIDAINTWIENNEFIINEGAFDNIDETVGYLFVCGQFNNWPGMIEMDISTNQLPKENDKLYEMFPELKDYIGVDGYSTTLILKEEVARGLFLEE